MTENPTAKPINPNAGLPPWSSCPSCRTEYKTMFSTVPVRRPRPNDLSLCMSCGVLGIVKLDFSMAIADEAVIQLTAVERGQIEAVRAHIAAVRIAAGGSS